MVKAATLPSEKIVPFPTHIAIIMDGNGRWAERRGLPRLDGHHAGTEAVRRVGKYLASRELQYLTLYGFSTENWNRPKEETRGLLGILREMIDQETINLHEAGVRLRHLGRLDRLSKQLQAKIRKAIELTKNNTGMTLSLAFDYGARTEILDAVRRILADGIQLADINEALFNSYLYTTGLPDVDLVIRTSGEIRFSNFLLWQAAYSEYYFTPTLWPDFDEDEIEKALAAYSQRQRRFGGVGNNGGREN